MVCDKHEPIEEETINGECLHCLLEEFLTSRNIPMEKCNKCGGIIILEPHGYGYCIPCNKV